MSLLDEVTAEIRQPALRCKTCILEDNHPGLRYELASIPENIPVAAVARALAKRYGPIDAPKENSMRRHMADHITAEERAEAQS